MYQKNKYHYITTNDFPIFFPSFYDLCIKSITFCKDFLFKKKYQCDITRDKREQNAIRSTG